MKAIITAIAAVLLATSSLSFAHSGGTDRNGCHVDHRTGIKHCH